MSEATKSFFAELQADQPSLGSELAAVAREGMKDVRSTMMETFLGSSEQSTEPGVPLNPTQYEVTQDRGTLEDRLEQYEPPQMEQGREGWSR